MRNRKLDARDIHAALAALRAGMPAAKVRATWDISVSTLYSLRRDYDGYPVCAIEQIEKLLHESALLRLRMKNLQFDCALLQASLSAQKLSTHDRRSLIRHIKNQFRTSPTRVCRLLGMSRTLYHYDASPPPRVPR